MTAADAPHQTYWARGALCPCGVGRGKCADHKDGARVGDEREGSE